MTSQELIETQHRQYAIDELATIDGVTNPSESQIKAKMELIASWPLFQNMFKQFGYQLAA